MMKLFDDEFVGSVNWGMRRAYLKWGLAWAIMGVGLLVAVAGIEILTGGAAGIIAGVAIGGFALGLGLRHARHHHLLKHTPIDFSTVTFADVEPDSNEPTMVPSPRCSTADVQRRLQSPTEVEVKPLVSPTLANSMRQQDTTHDAQHVDGPFVLPVPGLLTRLFACFFTQPQPIVASANEITFATMPSYRVT